MKRKDEELKFIGLDGFSEIESIVPESRLKPAKAEPEKVKKSAKKKGSGFASLGKMFSASKKTPEFAHTKESDRNHFVYKKRVVIGVAATVTVAMLSLVTVAGALDSGSGSKQSEPETTQASAAAALPATPDEPVSRVNTAQPVAKGVVALYIDGELIGVAEDGEALQNALDQILADAKAGYDDSTTTEFANKVEVKPYTGSQTPESVESLMEYSQYMYSIKMETDWVYEEEIPFETETTTDDSLPSDYEEITQEGVNGVKEYTLRLCFINGEQTDATVTKEKVISEPISEKKTIGTAEPVKEDSKTDENVEGEKTSSGSGSSTGSFMWPVPHTTNITSYMEWRWGRMHNGIDIAGGDDYGQPFVASDGGTVIWAGDDGGGYGNYVMIDHGNGYVTVYGHASELCCSTGDYVSQGQTIGYIGSTGNSTGPHLHFEVRLNGEYMDPTGYV